MNANPPSRWQSRPASHTKAGGITPASLTKALIADQCVFWVVIIGSLIVALFGA